MKRPYFNRSQRANIHCDTFTGSQLMLSLAIQKSLRDVYNADGWFAMKRMERSIVRLSNIKLLGRDARKKWWQMF